MSSVERIEADPAGAIHGGLTAHLMTEPERFFDGEWDGVVVKAREIAEVAADIAMEYLRRLPVEPLMEAMGMEPMWHCRKHGLSNMDWCSCDDALITKVWERCDATVGAVHQRSDPMRAGAIEVDSNVGERVCDRCARRASRWTYVDDATICGDCMDEHERALDAAVNAAWSTLPSGVQDYFGEQRDGVRRAVGAAVKAYIEWPGDV